MASAGVKAAVLVVLVLVLASCTHGEAAKPSTSADRPLSTNPAPTPPPPPRVTTTPSSIAPVQVEIRKSIWHGGWRVELVRATFKRDVTRPSSDPLVHVETVFENLGDELAEFRSQRVLVSGGKNYIGGRAADEIPTVPGRSKQTGRFVFTVEETFRFEDAVLTIGRPDNNQATVPLGTSGQYRSLEPIQLAVQGQITGQMSDLNSVRGVFDFHGAELRADLPAKHAEIPKGRLSLTLFYSLTNTGPRELNYYRPQSYFSLQLPDGTSVGELDDQDLIDMPVGTTKQALRLRFEIKDPPHGNYVLVHRFGTRTSELGFVVT